MRNMAVNAFAFARPRSQFPPTQSTKTDQDGHRYRRKATDHHTASRLRQPTGAVRHDPATDIAMLRAEAAGLAAMTWADTDSLKVGHISLARGRPVRDVRRCARDPAAEPCFGLRARTVGAGLYAESFGSCFILVCTVPIGNSTFDVSPARDLFPRRVHKNLPWSKWVK
jgi:hypothetical protein